MKTTETNTIFGLTYEFDKDNGDWDSVRSYANYLEWKYPTWGEKRKATQVRKEMSNAYGFEPISV